MKQKMHFIYLVAVLGLITVEAHAQNTQEPVDKFTRQSLFKKRTTLPSNTVDTNVIHVKFPKGYKTPAHTHEGPGPRYVIKGKLRVIDNGETNVFGPGKVFWETGSEMTVENIGATEAEILIIELAPVTPDKHKE